MCTAFRPLSPIVPDEPKTQTDPAPLSTLGKTIESWAIRPASKKVPAQPGSALPDSLAGLAGNIAPS